MVHFQGFIYLRYWQPSFWGHCPPPHHQQKMLLYGIIIRGDRVKNSPYFIHSSPTWISAPCHKRHSGFCYCNLLDRFLSRQHTQPRWLVFHIPPRGMEVSPDTLWSLDFKSKDLSFSGNMSSVMFFWCNNIVTKWKVVIDKKKCIYMMWTVFGDQI